MKKIRSVLRPLPALVMALAEELKLKRKGIESALTRAADWQIAPRLNRFDPMPESERVLRFWSLADVRGIDECWNWRGKISHHFGYGSFNIGHKKTIHAHRASFVFCFNVPPLGIFACHRCDNTRCVNPRHLYPGTPADNQRDRRERTGFGSVKRGTALSISKLTEAIVGELRANYTGRPFIKSAAKSLGVGYYTVLAAISGITWAHVTVPPVPIQMVKRMKFRDEL